MRELRGKGYTGFRVDKVSVAAGVSRGAQTHHFPTKEALVLAALESLCEASARASLKVAESLQPDDDVLAHALADAGRFYLGTNYPIALSMLNLGDHESGLRRKVQAMARKYRLPIERAWREALVRTGADEDTARTVLDLSFAVYRGMAVGRLLCRNAADMAALEHWAGIARACLEGEIAL